MSYRVKKTNYTSDAGDVAQLVKDFPICMKEPCSSSSTDYTAGTMEHTCNLSAYGDSWARVLGHHSWKPAWVT